MLALLLVACTDPGPGPAATEPGDSAEDSAGETGAVGPYDCGEPTGPPALAAGWTAGGPLPAGAIMSIVPVADGDLTYAASSMVGMWATQDDGARWDRRKTDRTHTLADLAVDPDAPQTVYRSDGGVLKRTRDGGWSWEDLGLGQVPQTGQPTEVWGIGLSPYDGDRIYALTAPDGLAHLSTDGGVTFVAGGQAVPAPAPHGDEHHYDNHGWRILPDRAPGENTVVASEYGVYVSDDGALATWRRTLEGRQAGRALLRDPRDAARLLVGGSDGLWSSADDGETWSRLDLEPDALVAGAWSIDGSWIAMASSTELYVTEDDGRTFATRALAEPDPGAIAILPSGRLLAAWDEGIQASDDRGQTWTNVSDGLEDVGMAVVVAHPVCPGRLLAGSLCSNGLFVSDDWGTTWEHHEHYMHYVMALHHDPRDPDAIWSVTDERLLRSTDGGETWDDVLVDYHFHGFAVHPEDGRKLLIGSVGSGEWADERARVYRSEDGGATWSDSSTGLPETDGSAHVLLHWPDDPDVVLLGTYKGGDIAHQGEGGEGLWRSEDGGLSWARADLDVADVAWLVAAPTGVVAVTDTGLWRSSDRGVTWTALDGPSGFMLSAAFVGDLGLAVSQTGALWRSDDGGETWQAFDGIHEWTSSQWLAQVTIAADASVAWLTVPQRGVWRIAL